MTDRNNEPEFLKVKSGDTVLIDGDQIAKVISIVGGARDPKANTLFQVANLDTDEIKYVDASLVKAIVSDQN